MTKKEARIRIKAMYNDFSGPVDDAIAMSIAIQSLTQGSNWIHVKLHETTDPDREPIGYTPEYIYDNVMPRDGQDILITVYDEQGRLVVKQDVCGIDVEEYYLESGKYDWFDDVVAWMPLPDPAESEDKK